MSELLLWEYSVEVVGGLFKFRFAKYPELQAVCTRRGREGWELTYVTYDWLTVTYVLFFKRAVTKR